MKNKNRGFSLIELSIVILIIGILIAGVTQGSRLVGASKLQTAQTLTQSSPVAGIEGLALWLETSSEASFEEDELEDEGALTQWHDINPQVSSSLEFLATTSDVTYEANGINGIPSVEFSGESTQVGFAGDLSGANEFLATPYSAYTFFIVHAVDNKTAAQALIYNGNEGTDGIGITTTATNGYISLDGAFTSVAGTDGFTDGAAQVSVVTIAPNSVLGQHVSAPQVLTYIDGLADVELGDSGSTLDAAIVTPSENFYIGNLSATANDSPLAGKISEIIVFDSVLKKSDRESVEDYLGQKYGIVITRQ